MPSSSTRSTSGRARELVERVLERLGPQHAEGLRLRDLEERPRDDVARLWGTDVNAVDHGAHRAKLVALHANEGWVVVIAADGVVVEGRRANLPAQR